MAIVQEEKLPYAFYISDQELVVELGAYLEKKKGRSTRNRELVIDF